MKAFRIGIVGGMGPLAGIELQRLIVESTPAESDQDHIQVVTFTNPAIPDRTRSLAEDDGQLFADAVIESGRLLERAGADIIALPCMTAHSRLTEIQAALSAPVANGIQLTRSALRARHSSERIAILATDGSINSGIYTRDSQDIAWHVPSPAQRRQVMDIIYRIKAGQLQNAAGQLMSVMDELKLEGVTCFLLGCTELGLLYEGITTSYQVVDPLRIMAEYLVERSRHQHSTSLESVDRTNTSIAHSDSFHTC